MIAHLAGTILRKGPNEVVVDVGGVGYRVQIPVSTFFRLGDEGSAVRLLIHTHVREDVLALFGFLSPSEQDLFERLIAVAGVGPKLAVNILSGIEVEELIEALRAGDIPRLTRIPGVGKKTAERLVVELKDKMQALALPASTAGAPQRPAGSMKEDLLSALANLGYTRADAERSVERALREGEAPFEDLLRRTLRILSGR
jgi:Holliday junction DNA helicase RuvA